MEKTIKSRKYMCLTYDIEKDSIETKITASGAAKWAYAIHDKDVLDDGTGERKKPHAHIVLAFNNARSVSAIANYMDILPQFVEPVKGKSERGALRYLLHLDDPGKHQYSQDTLVSAGYNKSIWAQVQSEEERVMQIIDLIKDPQIKTYSDLIAAAVRAGCWSELRRGGYLLTKAFEEERDRRQTAPSQK